MRSRHADGAVDKLEKQVLKLRERERDTNRGPKPETAELETPASAAPPNQKRKRNLKPNRGAARRSSA